MHSHNSPFLSDALSCKVMFDDVHPSTHIPASPLPTPKHLLQQRCCSIPSRKDEIAKSLAVCPQSRIISKVCLNPFPGCGIEVGLATDCTCITSSHNDTQHGTSSQHMCTT
jgi:hypothetical protein